MKITVLHSTHDLKNDSKPYYSLFRDVWGNFFQGPLGNLELYKESLDKEDLDDFKDSANIAHSKFDKVIKDVLIIIDEEKVKGRLLTLIKRLKKASNFDWSNIKKFTRFNNIYIKILKELS